VAGIEITRTELVWPGKYDDNGDRAVPERVNLPFQVIETINESRASREAGKAPAQTTLFDVWAGDAGQTFEEGWRNKLVWGDNLLVMSSLLDQIAGKVDLIYIDPPFATGADFSVRTAVGDQQVTKLASLVEEKAYRDTWAHGTDSYLAMLYSRLVLARDLLAPTGSFYLHLDWRVGSHARLLLDEVFGSNAFKNEIAWCYTGPSNTKQYFPRKHDSILYYTKGDAWHFDADAIRIPYVAVHSQGAESWSESFAPSDWEQRGKVPEDYWTDITPVARLHGERLDYETQKPEALLRRIIQASTRPGDLVADFFVGSGTTAAVAEKLGRRWIAADLGRYAIHTTRKRLMGIEGCKPFDVLNLGKYERQYWQRASFGDRDTQERVVFEYLAFILRLYGASPIPGAQHLHGKKGGVVVHIGAVDAPVTIAEVEASLDEAAATGQSELHVLGWEWEMGLNDLVNQLAQQRHVRLRLLAIPREVMEAQAVDRGDIRFFELAHLDAAVETRPKCALSVRLTDFAMSDADAIPEGVRDKITKWSDYVDYWSIDWDFRNDTFINGWVAYRTRRDRKLALESDQHTYAAPGTYHVAVKVVDIFGNDTTRVFPVEVGE
jgi:DNA modification methylase